MLSSSLEFLAFRLHDGGEAPAHHVPLEGPHNRVSRVLALDCDAEKGRQLAGFCDGQSTPSQVMETG